MVRQNEAFLTLMQEIHTAANGALPVSITPFMCLALTEETKRLLLRRERTPREYAAIMVAAGEMANHGSVEPVDAIVRRFLGGDRRWSARWLPWVS